MHRKSPILKKLLLLAGLLAFLCVAPRQLSAAELGVTFSQVQCAYLNLDWKETYEATLSLRPRYLRIAAYWSMIEKEESVYDFSELDWQIEKAREAQMSIVLAVGIKAPRWPETFIPVWILDKGYPARGTTFTPDHFLCKRALFFIEAVVRRYAHERAIVVWQVENEPLDTFGAGAWRISPEQLQKEIDLVHKYVPGKPILMTTAVYPYPWLTWFNKINNPWDPFEEALRRADIVSTNVYPSIGQKWGPLTFVSRVKKEDWDTFLTPLALRAEARKKLFWITELQAEPWEPGDLVHADSARPASISPEEIKTFTEYFSAWKADIILLWGVEYWYYRKEKHRDPTWWQTAVELFNGQAASLHNADANHETA